LGRGNWYATDPPTASVDEITEEVRRTLEIMASDGGYVFALTHNVQPDVTPERVDSAYDTVLKYRNYHWSCFFVPLFATLAVTTLFSGITMWLPPVMFRWWNHKLFYGNMLSIISEQAFYNDWHVFLDSLERKRYWVYDMFVY
jgi:hypothetical protein